MANDSKRRPARVDVRGPVRVFVGGTFDGLHYGHVFLLRLARRAGLKMAQRLGRADVHLTVVIARDDSVQRIKDRAPHHNQRERRQLVASLRLVDEAFVGYRDDFLRSVRRVHPDLIVLGYDQSHAWEEVFRRAGISARVQRCPEYRGHRLKSSMIRSDLERMQT